MQHEEKDKIVQKDATTNLEKVFEDTLETKTFKFCYLVFIIFEEIIFQIPGMIKEVKGLGFNAWSIVIWISIRLSLKIVKLYFFEFLLYVLFMDMLKSIIKNQEGFDRLRYFINKIKN